MKQTIMWLALALLFAIFITYSMTAGPFQPAAAVETTEPATSVAATQPIVTANAKPAQPEVPVVLLDDVPLKPTIGSEVRARWIVEPGASAETRAAEAAVVPSPLAPATTTTIAGQPRQDSKAGIKPLEGDAQPTRKPKDSKAEVPRQTFEPNGQRQGMRICTRPFCRSIATIKSRIALHDQAISRVRPTAYRAMVAYGFVNETPQQALRSGRRGR